MMASGDAGSGATNSSTGGNPCANVPSVDNGIYCATTTQFGFDPSHADGTSIYTCTDGQASQVQPCANGCAQEAMGTPDQCN